MLSSSLSPSFILSLSAPSNLSRPHIPVSLHTFHLSCSICTHLFTSLPQSKFIKQAVNLRDHRDLVHNVNISPTMSEFKIIQLKPQAYHVANSVPSSHCNISYLGLYHSWLVAKLIYPPPLTSAEEEMERTTQNLFH